jgi:hypothetical protein
MKLIITHFVIDPKDDEYRAGHANTQPCYVDKRMALATPKVPYRDGEIIF